MGEEALLSVVRITHDIFGDFGLAAALLWFEFRETISRISTGPR